MSQLKRFSGVRQLLFFTSAIGAFTLSGCGVMSAGGPSVGAVKQAADSRDVDSVFLVTLDTAFANSLRSARNKPDFANILNGAKPVGTEIGFGDTLSITIWEAPPATLFGSIGASSNRSPVGDSFSSSSGKATAFPDQIVNADGAISIPFAGQIPAVGLTTRQLETEIEQRLRGKAHLPQVMVSFSRNVNNAVTVVGEVQRSGVVSLSAKGERVLDAMALAGGTREPVNKITIQLARGTNTVSLPLETIIRDPQQNVTLAPGDIITAYFQPLSFTALGATGQNREVPFESTGMTLSQALGRIGGLDDQKANPAGAFIFRFEDPEMLNIAHASKNTIYGKGRIKDEAGRVAVVYRINLRDPASFFAAQIFEIKDRDVIYVSSSAISDVQKFVNIISSSIFPILSLENTLSN